MTLEEYAKLNAEGRSDRSEELVRWAEDAEADAGYAMYHGADDGRPNPVAAVAETVVELARLVRAMSEAGQR